MTDTAQPLAAESDGFADAASAFKVALGQEESKPLRDETSKFAAATPDEEPEEELEEEQAPIAEPETDEAEEEPEEADEANPEVPPMPTSWAKEDEETWNALPAEAQAKIAEREAQRDQAVNQKFQEAANVRKAHEAEITEARNSRQTAADLIDYTISLIAPEEPSVSMLNAQSSDYNPDYYHILKAEADQQRQLLISLASQRQELAAQEQAETHAQMQARLQQINQATAPALLKDIPEITDPNRAGQVERELRDYALSVGAPEDEFERPLSALEWHLLWKAKEYDRLQSAKGRVKTTPPPPKKPQPPVRPGVTTPRSTIERQTRQKDFNRLKESGSVSDGAAVFKHFLK
jgi:chemotaxis protein histidine kinase CheA